MGAKKAESKDEYLILNIGSGVQIGSSVVVLGVAPTLDEAMELIKTMGAGVAGKVAITRRETVITRMPVVELKESDESVLLKSKP